MCVTLHIVAGIAYFLSEETASGSLLHGSGIKRGKVTATWGLLRFFFFRPASLSGTVFGVTFSTYRYTRVAIAREGGTFVDLR